VAAHSGRYWMMHGAKARQRRKKELQRVIQELAHESRTRAFIQVADLRVVACIM